MREVTGEEPKVKSLAKASEGLKNEVEVQKKKTERDFDEYKKQAYREMDEYRRDMEKRISDLQQALKEASAASPSTPRSSVPESSSAEGPANRTSYARYRCGSREHLLRNCPKKTLVEKKAIWEKHESPKADHLRPSTKKKPLWIKNRRRRISALVDTGRTGEEDEMADSSDEESKGPHC